MISRRDVLAGMAASLVPLNAFGNTSKQARIIVSLADNENQGIVPIKSSLGNGQDPKSNLYWGALYGAKTHFKRMPNWSVKSINSDNPFVLDAFELSHVAFPAAKIRLEAWDGAKQRHAVRAYFQDLRNASSSAELVGFVGHNALMDAAVPNLPVLTSVRKSNFEKGRKGFVIACSSASYFNSYHHTLGVNSFVMTKGSMAPEAYVIEGILTAWLSGQDANKARSEAAKQYAKYQKIPIRNANWLFGVKT